MSTYNLRHAQLLIFLNTSLYDFVQYMKVIPHSMPWNQSRVQIIGHALKGIDPSLGLPAIITWALPHGLLVDGGQRAVHSDGAAVDDGKRDAALYPHYVHAEDRQVEVEAREHYTMQHLWEVSA